MNLQSDFDAIIFDFGGVLINIDYQLSISAFEALGVRDFNSLYNQAEQSKLFDDIETGKISAQFFINQLLSQLPPGTTANEVVSAWNAMILDVPADRVKLLQNLKSRGQKIYLLSNTNSIHIDKAWRKWKEAEVQVEPKVLFDNIYLSHEIGMRKPNKEIFEFVCTENALDPKRTLFIDDSIQHIEGASRIGIHAYHLKKDEDICQLFS
jgi:glucose-1-phosphatase